MIPANYVLLYMGDYDSSAWLTMSMPAAFSDPNRGKLPLCWPINPSPGNRTPNVFDFMYERQLPNDYFIGDHNGYGYIELVTLGSDARPANLKGSTEDFFRLSQEAWDHYDLDIMGFLINTTQPNVMYNQKTIRLMNDLAPYGVVYGAGGSGKPQFRADSAGREIPWSSHMDLIGGVEEAAQQLRNTFGAPSAASFKMLRCILKSPSWIKNVVDNVQTSRPQLKLTPVDPYVYDYLIRADNDKADQYGR